MQITPTTADANAVACWEAPHAVTDPDKVDDIAASMDSNPDEWVWDGPPLVADVEAGRLYSGVHRQAALQLLAREGGDLNGWAIPVVDLWDLIDEDAVDDRTADDDWDDAVAAEMATLDRATRDAIGWDVH